MLALLDKVYEPVSGDSWEDERKWADENVAFDLDLMVDQGEILRATAERFKEEWEEIEHDDEAGYRAWYKRTCVHTRFRDLLESSSAYYELMRLLKEKQKVEEAEKKHYKEQAIVVCKKAIKLAKAASKAAAKKQTVK